MAARVLVLYYSSTGNTHRLAQAVADGAEAVGAEVRIVRAKELAPYEVVQGKPDWARHLAETSHIPEATLDDLLWADAYALGSPVRFGNVAAQLKEFIDTTGPLWVQGKMADKPAAVFTTGQSTHGGQEATLLNLLTILYHWGCLIVPPGFSPVMYTAGGNPYGVSAAVPEGPGNTVPDTALAAGRELGRRVATVAEWVIASRAARV